MFHFMAEPQAVINDYLDQHNADPQPFVRIASASSIIQRVHRGKQAMESQHQAPIMSWLCQAVFNATRIWKRLSQALP